MCFRLVALGRANPELVDMALSQVDGLACQEVLGCNATALAEEYGITGALAPREEVYGFMYTVVLNVKAAVQPDAKLEGCLTMRFTRPLPGFDLKHCGGTIPPTWRRGAPGNEAQDDTDGRLGARGVLREDKMSITGAKNRPRAI
ncbi:hypothetical protein K438DRAFT_1757759 [Mycena galopus ATCC 62051]|nr:hypothetical protein K438DRAFT_1757759 [Mycena galopus ATCC 62051]